MCASSDQMFGMFWQHKYRTLRLGSFSPVLGLDETVGDIHSMIVGQSPRIAHLVVTSTHAQSRFADREIEIMQRLQETVLEYSESLRQTAQVCAEVDWL